MASPAPSPRRLSRTRSATQMGKRKIMRALKGGKSDENMEPLPRVASRSLTHDMSLGLDAVRKSKEAEDLPKVSWTAAVLAESNDTACDPSPNKRRRRNETDAGDIKGSASDVSQPAEEEEVEKSMHMFSPRRAISLASNFINRKKIKDDEARMECARLLSSMLFVGRHSDQMLRAVCEGIGAELSKGPDPWSVLFDVAHAHNQAFRVLSLLLTTEIESASEYATLFRGVSLCTRMMSHMLKTVGADYLKKTLSKVFAALLDESVGPVEVDTNRNGGDEGAAADAMQTLIRITKEAMHIVIDSLDECPMIIRAVLGVVHDAVARKFGDSFGPTAVGGFFFLRFLCPVLVAPTAEHTSMEITSQDRRKLVLASKILQNLSNGVLFADKEPYMCVQPLTDFMEESFDIVKQFLLDVSQTHRAYTPRFVFASKTFPAAYFEGMSGLQHVLAIRQHNVAAVLRDAKRDDLVEYFDETLSAMVAQSTKNKRTMKKVSGEISRISSAATTGSSKILQKRKRGDAGGSAPQVEEVATPARGEQGELLSSHRKRVRAQRRYGVRYDSQPVIKEAMVEAE